MSDRGKLPGWTQSRFSR